MTLDAVQTETTPTPADAGDGWGDALRETLVEHGYTREAHELVEPEPEPEVGDRPADDLKAALDEQLAADGEADLSELGDDVDLDVDPGRPLEDGEVDPLADPGVALLAAEARHRLASDPEYSREMAGHVSSFAATAPDFEQIRSAMGRLMLSALRAGRLMTMAEAAAAARQNLRQASQRRSTASARKAERDRDAEADGKNDRRAAIRSSLREHEAKKRKGRR